MKKTESVIETIEVINHLFYCDRCGKHLGTVEEYDDGWYETLGEFEQSFFIRPDGWYRVEKCFCEDCKVAFLEELKTTLQSMGFELDD